MSVAVWTAATNQDIIKVNIGLPSGNIWLWLCGPRFLTSHVTVSTYYVCKAIKLFAASFKCVSLSPLLFRPQYQSLSWRDEAGCHYSQSVKFNFLKACPMLRYIQSDS